MDENTELLNKINWFPGHMAKARRLLEENLKLADVVVELCDARLPISSRNPVIDRIIGQKRRVLVCNKADLSDSKMNDFWREYYKKQGITAIFTDCKNGDSAKKVIAEIKNVMSEKVQRLLDKGRLEPVIKVMVVGIPNVGKSSFINKISGKNVAVTGDKPGVTRDKQWLRINPEISLLDTPGLLWPKIENQDFARKLAVCGAIKDDILDISELASWLLYFLSQRYPGAIDSRFSINSSELLMDCDIENIIAQGVILLEACGRKRGCIIKGGDIDYTRISKILLDEFRGGKLGRITMDFPDEMKEKCETDD